MSSPDEGSVWGAGFGPEGGARAGVRPAEPGALRAVGLGPALGAPRSGEGEGGFPQPGGRPSCPADGRDAAADRASCPAPRAAANVVQQLTRRGICRYRSPESCAARGSTVWAGLEPGAGGPGAPALSWVASQPASAALLPLPGPEGGPAWGSPKRGGRSRLGSPASRGRPSAGGPFRLPSDPEPSDEASELQRTRRASAAPLDPATFPPVSDVPLLVRCRRAKQSKQPGTGKKSVAGRTMESQPVEVAGEDIDPNSDPAPRGQPPGHRPGPCSRCVRRPEGSSGHLNTRAAPQVAGNPQCLARSQGNTVPRGPAPSGDQEPLDRPPGRQRQQQPRGARGCPRVLLPWLLEMQAQTRRWGRCAGSADIRVPLRAPSRTPRGERTSFPRGAPASVAAGVSECHVLQREIGDLKEHLAAVLSLADKFQSL
ncbi:uncharacterized protein CXorf49-like [Equus caballus]|uniref:uncharacterized protein CXorf49-like n=1 Tax=Equus caballus TaxID=9796 RepID=UPI0038B32385